MLKTDPLNIELEITLKCNGKCLNCNKFCNMEDLGIIYGDEWDLSLEDVNKFIEQVIDMGNVNNIRIMGGEPTVHTQFQEICKLIKEKLVDTKKVEDAYVVTNGLIEKESCLRTYVQLPYRQKEKLHTCVLVSPSDLGLPLDNIPCKAPTAFGVSYNKLGWFPCGPGGAIARLFKLDHIRRNSIKSVNDWGDCIMDVCSLCQNISKDRLYERDHKRFITPSYLKAIRGYAF